MFHGAVTVQTNRTTDLVGKAIFHFGSHKKGGGCDFLVPLQNVKFHSELKVLADGNVVLSYCHRKVGYPCLDPVWVSGRHFVGNSLIPVMPAPACISSQSEQQLA